MVRCQYIACTSAILLYAKLCQVHIKRVLLDAPLLVPGPISGLSWDIGGPDTTATAQNVELLNIHGPLLWIDPCIRIKSPIDTKDLYSVLTANYSRFTTVLFSLTSPGTVK